MAGDQLDAGRVFVDLVPRLQQGFGAGVERELDGPLGRIRSKAAGIGKLFAAGIAGGAVVGGGLLLKAGADLDGFYDAIQIGSGKSGADLEALNASAKNVAREVPNSLEEVGTAIAKVSSRTGLTGKPLETMTKQLLTLSRLTGQDLNSTIEESTRTFGDWGIGVEEQGEKLDFLFKLSQTTGVGISDLQARLVKYGAPLRQLGFDYETSAAMIAKFEKEGVNTDLVLGSMRVALGKMAKAGEAPAETFKRVTDEIKNAGSAGEANALALELFGARAGPDMAAAIREGRFELGPLMKDLGATSGSIMDTAAETDDFAEKFAKLKNRAILAAEPLAGKVFDAVNKLADAAEPVVKWIGDRLPGAFESASSAVAPLIAAAKEVFSILFEGDFTGKGPWSEDSEIVDGLFRLRELFLDQLLPAGKAIVDFIGRNLKPILAVLGVAFVALTAPITGLIAGILFAYVRFGWFRDAVDAVVKWLIANVPPALAVIRDVIVAVFTWLQTNVPPIMAVIVAGIMTAWAWVRDNVLPVVREIVATVVAAFDSVVAWFRETWPAISEAIGHVIAVVSYIFGAFVSFAKALWQTFGDELLGIITTAWDFIRSTVENAINLVRSVIETVVALINGDWGAAWDGIKGILSAVWDQIVNIVSTAGKLAVDALEAVLSLLRAAWDGAWDGMKAVLGGLFDGLEGGAKFALNSFLSILEKAINFGIDLINTALDGIDKAAGPLVNFGEIPEVSIPRLAKGGLARSPGLSIVGDGGNGSGAEVLALPRGAGVVPLDVAGMIAAAALEGAGTGGGQHFDVKVDARGIQEPELVGDLTARHLGWRLTQRSTR